MGEQLQITSAREFSFANDIIGHMNTALGLHASITPHINHGAKLTFNYKHSAFYGQSMHQKAIVHERFTHEPN